MDEFEYERDFDYRTMYCEADVSEINGLNIYLIRKQVENGNFPEPFKVSGRALVWSKSKFDDEFAAIIASEPTQWENEKIEKYREIYDEAFETALPYTTKDARASLSGDIDSQAKAVADNQIDDDPDGDWDYRYEMALEEITEETEEVITETARQHAQWKARQAVIWRD